MCSKKGFLVISVPVDEGVSRRTWVRVVSRSITMIELLPSLVNMSFLTLRAALGTTHLYSKAAFAGADPRHQERSSEAQVEGP